MQALQPGLYETWILSEYCDQRTLQEAIAEGKLRLPGGQGPDMVRLPGYLWDASRDSSAGDNSSLRLWTVWPSFSSLTCWLLLTAGRLCVRRE